MIFLLVAGALIVGAPILAAILVAAASLREDAEHSLAGRPPGKLAAAARRLLSVRTENARAADTGSVSGPAYIDIARRSVANPGPTGPARAGTAPTGAALARVPAPRLADREQADHTVPIPQP